MARPAQVWTMGWRVPRAARGLGVEVVVWHTVPPLDGLLCCARCPHHGGPRLGLHEQHNKAVGFVPYGFPKRIVGHGWVPMMTEIAAVCPQVVLKLVKGQIRVYADATWGW